MQLTKTVKEMRAMAELLIPHTYPNVDFKEEYEVLPLKCRTITVDGYDVVVNFSKSDYRKYFVESLQIQSSYSYFLPFTLVCKVARAFLGSENLCFADFIKNNKKIYCWTLRTRNGKAISPSKKSEPTSYEGFEYNISNPGSVNLYER